jgi:hypothetical protein
MAHGALGALRELTAGIGAHSLMVLRPELIPPEASPTVPHLDIRSRKPRIGSPTEQTVREVLNIQEFVVPRFVFLANERERLIVAYL